MELCDEGNWPPGFRFHPTDEELILYYLKFKICRRKLKLDIICETDVCKWEPEELPGQSKLKTGDRQWFFFSPRERRYPNASRLNRATRNGYWKATGRDRIIKCNSRNVGVKKTLVFYQGRAPVGERTDWVMHEYTLDEDELKRCKNVKDYYALYKLYKKSGPGPKNGEQYGALFREEDWDGEECRVLVDSNGQESQVKILDEVTSVDCERVNNGQIQLSSDDIEELLQKFANDPVLELPSVSGYHQFDSAVQVDGKEETISTMIDAYSQDHTLPGASKVFHLSDQPSDSYASFDLSQTGISQLQSIDGVISSDSKYCKEEEDFLEINDLIGPEPTLVANVNLLGTSEFDGLDEFEQFHDANMFLRDLGPVIPETFLDSDVANNLNGHLQLQYDPFPQNHIDSGFWKNNETDNGFSFPELHQQFGTQPNLGMGYESASSATPGIRENQIANDGNGSSSWFSSNLWAFVESIPTTPASASENVNRAFERMSSFSRLRLNTLNTLDTNVSKLNPETGARRAGMNQGFLLFSIIVVLCAILWLLIKNAGLWGRGTVS